MTELEVEQPDDETMCPECGKQPATAPHKCPYQDEINDDQSLCRCCADCEEQCATQI